MLSLSPERLSGRFMRRWCILWWIALASAAGAFAQDTVIHAAVSYISGSAVYISAGRNSGVVDSTLFPILRGRDTVAVLKSIASSSNSSVCRIVVSRKELHIGDSVYATVPVRRPVAVEDSVRSNVVPESALKLPPSETVRLLSRPAVTLSGRFAVQYVRTSLDAGAQVITQPGIVLDLRTGLRDLPLTFDAYANLRVRNTGPEAFWGPGRVDQSRLYRLSAAYRDSQNTVSAGRMYVTAAPTAGSIDGVIYTRSWSSFSLGTAVGYDALGGTSMFSSDMKKFLLFGTLQSPSMWNGTFTAAYLRSYNSAVLDRELASAGFALTPTSSVHWSGSADIDLRMKAGGSFSLHPRLTSLYSTLTWRASSFVSAGLGVTAWRPVYFYSTVAAIPDDQLDQTLRTTPTVTVSLYPASRVILYDSYSPRQGQGKGEYLNVATCTISRMMMEELSVSATWTENSSVYSKTRGVGAGARYSAGPAGDFGVRYQRYSYMVVSQSTPVSSSSLVVDALFFITRAVTANISMEKMSGGWSDGYTMWFETGIRF